MAHILLTIKSLLFQPNPESALNEEAGKLLLEDYEEYRERAAMWTSIHANGFKDIFPSSSEPLTDSTSESLNVPMSNSSASMKKITTATATAAVKKADAVKKSSLKRL